MSGKVTIDLDAAAALIAESAPQVFEALGVSITRQFANYATCIHGPELQAIYAELGRNTAALFVAIDEAGTPPAAPADPDACPHTIRMIDARTGKVTCSDCKQPVSVLDQIGPRRLSKADLDARRPRGGRK